MAAKKIEAPVQSSAIEIAEAIRAVVEAVKPKEKKTIVTRKAQTPWTPPEGVPRLKLKRKIFQHSLPVYEDRLTNEQIEALNKLKPGTYFDGWVKVNQRRDKGLDIDYPVKNVQQRLKLTSVYKVTSFLDLIQKLNAEAAKPKKSEFDPNQDDF